MNIIETQVYDIFSLLLFCLLFIRFIDGTNWEKFARADYRVGNTSVERPVSLGSFPLGAGYSGRGLPSYEKKRGRIIFH